jgi:hypothetical protein
MSRGVAGTFCNSLENSENILQHAQHEQNPPGSPKPLILLVRTEGHYPQFKNTCNMVFFESYLLIVIPNVIPSCAATP